MKVNPKFYRPTEVDQLLGDPAKARSKLDWRPRVTFGGLVKDMMDSDIKVWRDFFLSNVKIQIVLLIVPSTAYGDQPQRVRCARGSRFSKDKTDKTALLFLYAWCRFF